jgi:hypothetical protein
MRAGWAAVVLLLALATDGAAADARRPDAGTLVDTVVAEVAARAITLSDVALARALGVLGLEPSTEPISDAALAKYLDAQLALHEATHLAIEVTAADIDRAWEEAGGTALADRFARVGIAPGWARRLLEEDLRVTRFVELRFQSFACVTEFDVDEALRDDREGRRGLAGRRAPAHPDSPGPGRDRSLADPLHPGAGGRSAEKIGGREDCHLLGAVHT